MKEPRPSRSPRPAGAPPPPGADTRVTTGPRAPADEAPPAQSPPAGEPPASPVVPEARPGGRTVALRLAVAGLIVAADLASKDWVFAFMRTRPEGLARDAHGHERLPLVGDWLAFMLTTNPGAAFGGFASTPHLLVGGRILAVVFLVWLLARTAPGRRVFGAALVLVLGGALGNLFDNLFAPEGRSEGQAFGEVRDFIDVYFRFDWTVPLLDWRLAADWHFPTFNVADACITVGAVLLLLSGLFREGEERAPRSGGRRAEGGPPPAEPAAGAGPPAGSVAPPPPVQ